MSFQIAEMRYVMPVTAKLLQKARMRCDRLLRGLIHMRIGGADAGSC